MSHGSECEGIVRMQRQDAVTAGLRSPLYRNQVGSLRFHAGIVILITVSGPGTWLASR